MKKTGQQLSWLGTFFALAGINNIDQIDYSRHHNQISQCVSAANPVGLQSLGQLIMKARQAGGSTTIEFKHIKGDPECLCSLCRGEEGQVVLGMYRHFGFDITLGDKAIIIQNIKQAKQA